MTSESIIPGLPEEPVLDVFNKIQIQYCQETTDWTLGSIVLHFYQLVDVFKLKSRSLLHLDQTRTTKLLELLEGRESNLVNT